MSEEIVVEDYMLEEIETWKHYLSKEEFQDAMLHFEDHKPKYIDRSNSEKPVEFVTIKRRVLDYSSEFDVDDGTGTSCSSSTCCEESDDLCKEEQLSALHGIAEYYDRRGLKRKLGFAGLGNDEDRQGSRKKTSIVDWGNLNMLVDTACSMEVVKPVIRLKIIHPAVIKPVERLNLISAADAEKRLNVIQAAAIKPVERLKVISAVDAEKRLKTIHPADIKPIERLKVISAADTENRSEIAKVKSKTSRKMVKVKKNGKTGKTKTKKGSDKTKFDVPVVKDLPPEYLEEIKKLNGRDIQKIEEKPLTASDVNPNLCRLLLNHKDFAVEPVFLTYDEERKIAMKDEFIMVKLLEPMGCYQEIKLKKWRMNQNCYNALLKPWKYVAANNGFGVNDVVQVWSFRFDEDKEPNKLGVAIVRIFTAPRETSTSGSSGTGCGSSSLCSS